MKRDTLFLLTSEFLNPGLPERRFYCWECMLLEGVLARFGPALRNRVDAVRLPWPKPRSEFISRFGLENQDLPLLLLSNDEAPDFAHRAVQGQFICVGRDEILPALAIQHDIPWPHP